MTEENQQTSRRRVGLIVALVVALGAAVTGFLYMRSREPEPAPSAPAAPAAEAPALQGTPIAPGTVASWQWRDGAPGLYHGEGLQLRLERAGGGDDYQARLFISGGGGPAHEMTVETAGPVDVAVGDFDRQAPGPEVLVGAYSGGAHCCTQVHLVERAGGGWRAIDLGSWDGGGITAPVDYDKDGVPEIERADNRFLYAFEAYAMSLAPPRFFNVRGGEVVEVSTAPGLKPQFEALLPEYRKACEAVSNGGCAGYVAAAARAGKLKEAWRVMMKSYDRTSDWGLPPGCAAELVDDKCPAGQEITFTDYPDALASFLKDAGYITERPSVLDLAR